MAFVGSDIYLHQPGDYPPGLFYVIQVFLSKLVLQHLLFTRHAHQVQDQEAQGESKSGDPVVQEKGLRHSP